MADSFYTAGRALLQAATISWASDTIGVALVSAVAYQFDPAHLFYTSIEEAALAFGIVPGATDVAGSVNSDPITILGIESDQAGHALVFYHETFDSATSELLSYHDTTIGLPVASDGTAMQLVLPHGPEGLFNYISGVFGLWEGVRNSFGPPPNPAAPCSGGVSRYLAF